MRKSMAILLLILGLSLLYVRAQIGLVRISYQIRYKESRLEELTFQNQTLEYELAFLEAPGVLENNFYQTQSEGEHFNSWQLAGVVRTYAVLSSEEPPVAELIRPSRNLWSSLFTGAVAEARTDSDKE